MTESKEIATVEETAVVAAGDSWETMESYDGETGFEDLSGDDLQKPTLILLQNNSPVVDEKLGQAGQIWNTAMETASDSITFIPVQRVEVYIEKKTHADGGDYIATHLPDAPIVQRAIADNDGKKWGLKAPNGTDELIQTIYIHCIVVDEEGGLIRATIPFKSVKLKILRQFMMKATSQMVMTPSGKRIRLPLWAHAYKLTAAKETFGSNTAWNYRIAFAHGDAKSSRLKLNDELFQEANTFRNMLVEGTAQVDVAAVEAHEHKAGGAGEDEASADIPF